MITDAYRRLNRLAHEDPKYGRAARLHGALVQSVINRTKAKTLLDYGCGKQALRDVIQKVVYAGYDPALPGLDARPSTADVVYCGDVMEHVEPEFVEAVLADVVGLARKAAVFVISCAEGNRRLPDGSLAHRSVHPPEWWRAKLEPFGRLEEHRGIATQPEYRVVVWR